MNRENRLDPSGRYTIYLRKSRADLDGSVEETLSRHKETLYTLATRYGLSIERVFEEVVSGETIASRPQVQKLLSEIAQRKWDGVLVMEVERLARGNTRDQGTMADAFRYTDTKIITPMRIFDPQDPDDMEYLEFGLFMSRREYTTIRRRMQFGIDKSVSQGQWLGSTAPYGYSKCVINKQKTLRPNDDAPMLKQMFEWVASERLPVQSLVIRMTDMGIPSPNHSPHGWNNRTMRNILTNPAYIGKIRWGRNSTMRSLDPDTMEVTKRTVRLKEGYRVVDGLHEPLISKELFYAVQEVLISHASPVNKRYDLANPFAGILKCEKCGLTMQYCNVDKRNNVPRYVHKKSAMCKAKGCKVGHIVEAVCEALEQVIGNYETSYTDDTKAKETALARDMKASLETEYSHVADAKASLFDRLERNVIGEDDFVIRLRQLKDKAADIEQRIIELGDVGDDQAHTETITLRARDAIELLRSGDDPAKVNMFLRSFIREISYANESGYNKNDRLKLSIFFR